MARSSTLAVHPFQQVRDQSAVTDGPVFGGRLHPEAHCSKFPEPPEHWTRPRSAAGVKQGVVPCFLFSNRWAGKAGGPRRGRRPPGWGPFRGSKLKPRPRGPFISNICPRAQTGQLPLPLASHADQPIDPISSDPMNRKGRGSKGSENFRGSIITNCPGWASREISIDRRAEPENIRVDRVDFFYRKFLEKHNKT